MALEIGTLNRKADGRRDGQPFLSCTPRRIDCPLRRRAALRQRQNIQQFLLQIVRAGNRHTVFRQNARCQRLHGLQYGIQHGIFGSGLFLQPDRHLASAEGFSRHTTRRIVRSYTNFCVLLAVGGKIHLCVQRRLAQLVAQQLAVRKVGAAQNFRQQPDSFPALLRQTSHTRHQLHPAMLHILAGQRVDLKTDAADLLLDQHLQFLAAVLFCASSTQQHTHGGQHRQFLLRKVVCLKVHIQIHKACVCFMAQHRYISVFRHGNGQILRRLLQIRKLQHRDGPDRFLAVGGLLPTGQLLCLLLQRGTFFGRPRGSFCRQPLCFVFGFFCPRRVGGYQHRRHAVAFVQKQFPDQPGKQVGVQISCQFFQRLLNQQRLGGVAAVQPAVQHGQRFH